MSADCRWSEAVPRFTVIDMEEDQARVEFRIKLGITLKRVRQKLTPYTQQTMADAIGMNRDTYGSYERGKTEPKAYDLARVWSLLGAPGDWLLRPTSDVNEVDRWIEAWERERRLRAVQEAGQDDEADESDPEGDGRGAAPRGRR